MDRDKVLKLLNDYLTSTDRIAGHKHYHDDAVLEFPQSGERFEGVGNFSEWRAQYPAKVEFDFRDLRGRDDFWVAEGRVRYDEGPWSFGVTIMEFRDGKIARETIYGGEAWEAPEWRKPWRAAP